jgi:hypothetical protein
MPTTDDDAVERVDIAIIPTPRHRDIADPSAAGCSSGPRPSPTAPGTNTASHAGQLAGEDEDVLAVKNAGPQIHVPAFEMTVRDRRHAGERQRGLRDVIARIGLDPPREFAALFGAGVGPTSIP